MKRVNGHSIMLSFVENCCLVGEGYEDKKQYIWSSFQEWFEISGLNKHNCGRNNFYKFLDEYFKVGTKKVHGLMVKPEYSWEFTIREEMGNVYLITDGTYIKIGYSLNPVGRMKQIQTGNPHELTMVAYFPGDQTLEKHLHEQYSDKRIIGEWFDLTFDDVENICSYGHRIIQNKFSRHSEENVDNSI